MKSTKAGPPAGWPISILLLVLYVCSEWGTRYLIGGDLGAFLYVTSHFIVMPALSIAVIAMSVVRVVRAPGISRKLLVFSSVTIPAAILIVAISGDPGLSRFFGHF